MNEIVVIRAMDIPMDKDELESIRVDALGLERVAFASFIDVEARTVRNWLAGTSPIPRTVVLLLRIMKDLGLKPDDIRSRPVALAAKKRRR